MTREVLALWLFWTAAMIRRSGFLALLDCGDDSPLWLSGFFSGWQSRRRNKAEQSERRIIAAVQKSHKARAANHRRSPEEPYPRQKGNPRLGIALFVVLLFAASVHADIPVVGRPADLPFSGASARFARDGDAVLCPFRVEASVSPEQVEAEQPLTFAVTITALGKIDHPPRRIDPREVPSFARLFHIEDITDGKKERLDPTTWRWLYRLKPRRAGIDQVPRLPFVFHNPDLRPDERSFQTIWTEPKPITVTAVEHDGTPRPVTDGITVLVPAHAVLGDRTPWGGPSLPLLAAVLGVPPLLCAGWYLVWRMLNPDAARRAALRRSRAARVALASLKAASRLNGRTRAEGTAVAIVDYLRERFELPVTEPTPDEAADWVQSKGVAPEPLRRLLTLCAEGRFAPAEGTLDVVEQARAFVISAEEPPCPPSS